MTICIIKIIHILFFTERHLEEEFDSNKCTICKITFENSKLLTRHALKKHGDMIEKLPEQQGNLLKGIEIKTVRCA